MKIAHEAAAWQGWLAQQVQESINDPRLSISHSEALAEWEVESSTLAKQVTESSRRSDFTSCS